MLQISDKQSIRRLFQARRLRRPSRIMGWTKGIRLFVRNL